VSVSLISCTGAGAKKIKKQAVRRSRSYFTNC